MTSTNIELEAGPIRNLLAAEPPAGIVVLKFLQNLMDLNPALRPPMERSGADEFELWQNMWSWVYAMPFSALTLPKQPVKSTADQSAASQDTDATSGAPCSAVGEALLWTLESCFREDFTPEARHAWETLYRFVNKTAWMTCGEAGVPVERAPSDQVAAFA